MISPELAQKMLSLDFTTGDRARYEALSTKASEGTLTAGERGELEEFVEVNDLLGILKSKAEASLRPPHPAA
jgi:hypothetical protein